MSFYKNINDKIINDMIEIIKIIGVEDYLEFTNKFYERILKKIKDENLNVSPSYNKEEFLSLMKYIIKKMIKKDNLFLKNLHENFILKNKMCKNQENNFLENVMKFYIDVNKNINTGFLMDKDNEEIESIKNEEIYKLLKNKKI